MDNQEKPYTKYKSGRHIRRRPLVSASGEGPAGGPPGSPPDLRKPPKGPRKPRRWRRRIALAVLGLVVLALLGLGVSYWRLDRAVAASNDKVPADARQALSPAGDISSTPQNILFIGSDKRPNESARSDTILLVRVDGEKKIISQLSIPRDTLVDVPGYGQGKINSAYDYGGPALLIKTVEQLTGVPVNHYVELNFNGFPAIVDSLGGVDIDVPSTIDSQYPDGTNWTRVHFDPGMQHMDGARALVYVRVRYSDDDFHRMARQQQFMQALQQKASSPFNVLRLPLIAPDIIGDLTTDISTNDLLRLGWIKFRTPAANNHKFVLVGPSEDIGGVSFVVLDDTQAQSVIQQFLAG